jgi:hypothetical protein
MSSASVEGVEGVEGAATHAATRKIIDDDGAR